MKRYHIITKFGDYFKIISIFIIGVFVGSVLQASSDIVELSEAMNKSANTNHWIASATKIYQIYPENYKYNVTCLNITLPIKEIRNET